MKNIRRIAVLFAIIVLISFSVNAAGGDPITKVSKNVKVSGKIIDQQTGEALTGVKIYFEGNGNIVYSDFDGDFEIDMNLSENQDLEISLTSYEAVKLKVANTDSYKIELKRIN